MEAFLAWFFYRMKHSVSALGYSTRCVMSDVRLCFVHRIVAHHARCGACGLWSTMQREGVVRSRSVVLVVRRRVESRVPVR